MGIEEQLNGVDYELDELQVEHDGSYLPKSKNGWMESAPIGVVIGVIAVAVLILSLLLFFCVRRFCFRRRRSKKVADNFDESINFVSDGLITNLERRNKPFSDVNYDKAISSNLHNNNNDSSTFTDVELCDDSVSRISNSFKNII